MPASGAAVECCEVMRCRAIVAVGEEGRAADALEQQVGVMDAADFFPAVCEDGWHFHVLACREKSALFICKKGDAFFRGGGAELEERWLALYRYSVSCDAAFHGLKDGKKKLKRGLEASAGFYSTALMPSLISCAMIIWLPGSQRMGMFTGVL